MAKKNNIRSIRFSDELAELIDRQIGDTFTEKFENLVTKCVWELPQKEKELKSLQETIDHERERLRNLRALYQKQDRVYQEIQGKITSLLLSINRANQEFL